MPEVETKPKRGQVALPRQVYDDLKRLAALYSRVNRYPTSLGQAVAQAVGAEMTRMGGAK